MIISNLLGITDVLYSVNYIYTWRPNKKVIIDYRNPPPNKFLGMLMNYNIQK